jgi:hypothetical protein
MGARMRWVIPVQLAVTVVAAGGAAGLAVGCGAMTVDAPDAARTDGAAWASDGAHRGDGAGIPAVEGGCFAGARLVGYASACLPAYPARGCSVARACRSGECGAGCAVCDEVFRCYPRLSVVRGEDGGIADGAVPACDSPRFTCDRFGCEPECQTVPLPRMGGGGVG